jgi:hypothetical protein
MRIVEAQFHDSLRAHVRDFDDLRRAFHGKYKPTERLAGGHAFFVVDPQEVKSRADELLPFVGLDADARLDPALRPLNDPHGLLIAPAKELHGLE